MAASKGPSKVETIKQNSRGLRGRVVEQLAEPAPVFGDGDEQLLKFHGIYQGYDRDSATALKQAGAAKEFEFMARIRAPGGRLTAAQYLVLDDLAGRYGHGSLRLTTRQGIQFHGLAKGTLWPTLHAVNAALMTTFAACGDVVRNVTSTPAPIADAIHRRIDADSALLSTALLPHSTGYHEIWVADERVTLNETVEEPVYGATYLPRKFKIGLTHAGDNSIDVLTNDLGIIAEFDGDTLTGYVFAIGGGLGMTHNKPATYPRLATALARFAPDQLIAATEAVIKVQRDHGDRTDRKHARLKYLIDERGDAWFRAAMEHHLGCAVTPVQALPALSIPDHLDWHAQGDGRWWLGVPVPSGRIRDQDGVAYRSAFRAVAERFAIRFIVTPQQDMLIADIAAGDRAAVEAELARHGVVPARDISPVARWALACVALPSCGLALTEAERVRQPIIEQIHRALVAEDLGEERISVRITGCPNGCARPYAGDIGLVGRVPGFYALYLGGDFEGTRLNRKIVEKVPLEQIGQTLRPVFARFRAERRQGEGFGDFCHRLDEAALLAMVAPGAEVSAA